MSQWCPNGGPAISDVASRSPSRKAYLKASRSVSRNQGGFLEKLPGRLPGRLPGKVAGRFPGKLPGMPPEMLPGSLPGRLIGWFAGVLPEIIVGRPSGIGWVSVPGKLPGRPVSSGDVCTIPPVTRNVGMEGSRVFIRTPPSRHIEGHDIS